MSTHLERLKERLARITDLDAVRSLLGWDQQVTMPPGSNAARSHHLATVTALKHALFVADETGDLLEGAADEVAGLSYDSDDASLVRVARREYEKLRRVPESLMAERARVHALSYEAWVRARDASDFALFRPHLERVIDLTIEYAEALGYEERRYDALLDRYEPEMKTTQVAAVLAELKAGQVPLVQAIAERGRLVDNGFLHQEYPDQAQWEFSVQVLKDMGFDFTYGRQDRAVHPFTTSFSPQDVRLTTRIRENDLTWGLFSSIHEGGHALYDQGVRVELGRTPLFDGASYGVHESQSRLWENIVGRSRHFCAHYFPRLRKVFRKPLAGVDVETFYRAVNKVEPSFIRTEADEVTYNLHIFLRFELEQELVERRLSVADLPEAWNAKMKESLGITPPDDTRGVLQDVHWAEGLLGYFPSYTLGNLLAVQFYNQALKDMPDLTGQIAQGQLLGLRGWLRANIHAHGKKFTPAELVQRVTGGGMSAAP